MTDTNILISAVLFPEGKISYGLKAIADNHELVLCDYILTELETVLARKFKSRLEGMHDNFIGLKYKIIPTEYEIYNVPLIRDINDAPILASAINYGVDVLITGDKDFLVLRDVLQKPLIMTMKEFILINKGE